MQVSQFHNDPYSQENFESVRQAFLAAYPEFAETKYLDELRGTEYRRLDDQQQVYLDYTGGGLYAESQLTAHFEMLRAKVLGNPHSINPTSLAMTDLVEETRAYVLKYFNAAPGEYTVVFTSNASGALKLVGEAYPFNEKSRYLLTFDNHNSVNGIREFARAAGAEVTYVPLTSPTLRIDRDLLASELDNRTAEGHHLFAFPAQSNFSGVKHPLDFIEFAHEKGWDVLLDAAAFVPTNRLDLSEVKPDFVTMSFYKMFGYPTGIGALLIRNSTYERLHRPWFAGGTVNFASVQARAHVLSAGEAAFEDGTVNYLGIPGVKIGLQHLESIRISVISERVRCLTGWLIDQLMDLRHSNGSPMVRMYGPANTKSRGGTVTMNLYDPSGHLLDYRRIEELATDEKISLRTGCFCNPGAGEIAEGLTEEDMIQGLKESESINLPRFLELVQSRGNKSVGAIRVSVGLATNFEDVYRFMSFAEGFKDQTNLNLGEVTFNIESCRVVRDGA